MLEGLTTVAWADLEHAYGSAADVPDQLRALLSPEAEVRDKARWRLYGNIFHQGSRYEASAYAVPFLLELLADPATPERAAVLGLVTSLAIGYDEAWLPGGFPVGEYRREAAGGEELLRAAPSADGMADDGTRFAYWESLEREQQERLGAHIEVRVYDAVRTGVPLLRGLLRDDDPGVRAYAAYGLGWFGEDAADTVPALRAAAGDPHPTVAAVALVALGLLGTADGAAVRIVEAGLDDHRDVVRWGAAVALARLRGAAAGPRVADELLAWARREQANHDEVPYLDGDLSGYAALALRQLGDAAADAAFDALLARLGTASGPLVLPVLGEALHRAFPDGPLAEGVTFADLDQRQQRLLRVLADTPGVWRWGDRGTFANVAMMISEYHLPGDLDAMRSYTA